jgi:hypothetical protein
MLYIVSRPAAAGFIDPRMTAKSLLAELDPLGAGVRIDFCRPPTLARMEKMLRSALVSRNVRWIETGPQGRTIALEDWFLPHLYQRGPDEPLLPPEAAAGQSLRQYDLFLSHNHNDSACVEALARRLDERLGLRVGLDKWECGPGRLEPQCKASACDSRFTVVAGSQAALDSKRVRLGDRQAPGVRPRGRPAAPDQTRAARAAGGIRRPAVGRLHRSSTGRRPRRTALARPLQRRRV